MRDRAAERALVRAVTVDVDPLVVAGGVRELVDPVLVIVSQSVGPITSPIAALSSSRR